MARDCKEDIQACPFQRINDVSSLDASEALDRFMTHGFLWVKSGKNSAPPTANVNPLSDFFSKHSLACQAHWSIENCGDLSNENEISPETLSRSNESEGSPSSFYVSTIIPKTQEEALQDLLNILPPFYIFHSDMYHILGGAWVFCGSVTTTASKKRKRPLVGRAEHVDEVPHSGTWHYQCCGTKTWLLRPHIQLFEKSGKDLPDLKDIKGAERNSAGAWRLRIAVEPGDWILIDTKIWYHCTELEHDSTENSRSWIVSIARDFYLSVPCPEDVEEGHVLMEEDDIPEDMPLTLDADTVNCALAEIEDEETGQSSIVLIATKEIKQGEPLFLKSGVDDDDKNNDITNEEYNADETVDPRAVAARDFRKGDVVLRNDELPDELPRSNEPNCELVADGDDVVVKALQDISKRDIFCILPDGDEDYEEVEVDLATGDLTRTN